METNKPNMLCQKNKDRLKATLPFMAMLPKKTITFFLLGGLGFILAILITWLFDKFSIFHSFNQFTIADKIVQFLTVVPQVNNPIYLSLPTIILFLISWGVMKISPQHKRWSKLIIVSILLILTIRYLAWRSLSSLNLSHPVDGFFSLLLLAMECLFIFSNILQLYLMLNIKDRRHQANQLALNVINKKFTPSVAILITTYNEPEFIIRRTIMGCQNINYDHKTIYLLDDGRREVMKTLTEELGCQYITRPNNQYAKAGNLNNALIQINEELVAVFDADFIPSTNFLNRTIGFFQDQKIALVQTNQNFYNIDPIARNLGLEKELTEEVEIFSRHYQLIRDSVETMVCYGSSFLARKSYLDEIGGFVKESLSEDYFTGIKLSAKGYKCIYLDEKLSAGLAAENMAGRLSQRLRWSRGTLQSFFIDSNPLTIPGLNIIQRLAHFEGILQWFAEIPRIFFLFLPLLISIFGIIPLRLNSSEWLYYCLPYYLLSWQTYTWINRHSRSAIFSDLYSVSQCLPLSINVFKVLSSPFSEGFKVTPKGLSQKHFIFNWQLAFPLLILLGVNLLSFFYTINLYFTPQSSMIEQELLGGLKLILLCTLYNIIILTISIFVMVDAPKSEIYNWFKIRKNIYIFEQNYHTYISASINGLSEIGAEIEVDSEFKINQLIKIKLPEENLILSCKITGININNTYQKIQVKFQDMNLSEERKLIKLLYGNSDQWKRKKNPGELQSLWLMLKVLVRPNFLRKYQ